MKRIVLLSLALIATLALSAQTAREEVEANPQVVIPTMTVYNGELFPVEAPAVPKGFKPVFIAGYLRHGSRLEALEEYPIDAYNYFKKADEAGILTPLGKKVKEFMKWNMDKHEGRVGDLTDVGFEQHKQIAKRYYKRYSSLFKGGAKVESKGSTELRAAMSMVGFNEGLKECNPRLRNHMEASEAVTGMIRPQKSAHNKGYSAADEKAYKAFLAKEVFAKLHAWGQRQNFDHAKNAMFTDPQKFFSLFKAEPSKIINDIYKRLAFAQNMGINDRTLIDQIFTPEERYNIYMLENCRWHYRSGSAAHPILANNMAQSRLTIDYLVEQIDRHIAGESDEVMHLCFGHDLNIIPLMNIFGLDNMPLVFGEGNETIDYVAENWRGYKVTPKAGNIMLIIYRNKEGKTLVRPQMNERDVTMPIESAMPYFYEWDSVKKLAYERLAEIDRLKQGACGK